MLVVVPLDRTHITVKGLEDLLPEAFVAGGSFARDLQHPIQIPRKDRKSVFENAQTHAIDDCIHELCSRAGLPKSTRVKKGPGGERLWPNGYLGSLSHKATVVLGALAGRSVLRAVGIDIEFFDSSKLGSLEKSVAWEGLPSGTEQSRGVLLALSAKEAVFKAQYPLTGKLLSFSDVALMWTSRGGENFSATVKCGSIIGLEIRCAQRDRWIISGCGDAGKTLRGSFFAIPRSAHP